MCQLRNLIKYPVKVGDDRKTSQGCDTHPKHNLFRFIIS